jgi:hypothetical protein
MGHRELERVEHGEGRQPEKEVKIKIEVSSKNFAHYECHIRTIGASSEDIDPDILFEEAMALMRKMDLAMEQRNGGLLE